MKLKVSNLKKSYGGLCILDSFNYEFIEGRTTCILGESGRGKTTLIRILMGLDNKDTGELEGFEAMKKSAVFQEDRLCQNLSAISNVKLTSPSATKKEEIISNLISVGLGEESLLKPVRELSGGMQRRVAIVRALIAEYEILFLDEPFKGLDVDTRNTVIDFVKERTKEKTVIMITHNEEEVTLMNGIELRM